jgi:hypothetical protein
MFPSAHLIGTDLGWVPPNVRFEIDDATQEWIYAEDQFDFVHIRTLRGSIEIVLGCLAMLTGSSALLRLVGGFLVIEVGCEKKGRRR